MKQVVAVLSRFLVFNFLFAAFVVFIIINSTSTVDAINSSYQSWTIPENTAYSSQIRPHGKPFIAPNGNYWYLTVGSGSHTMLNYIDKDTGTIHTPDYFQYICCVNGSPSPQDSIHSYFVADSTGKVWYTGADYSVYEVNMDLNGNPISFGSRIWLPPATGPGAFGGSNWGPKYFQIGPDNTFWYVNGNLNIKNTQQNGTVIREFTAPGPVSGMQFDNNGNIWISTDSVSAVGISKLDLATGSFTSYPLDFSSGFNLTLESFGPDGNMWFLHDNINFIGNPMRVGVITPDGVINYPDGLFASEITRGHGNTIVLASREFNKIQLYDVITKKLTSYGRSSQIGFYLPARSINNKEYWYISKQYPKSPTYTGTESYEVTKAILDEKNGTAIIASPKINSYFTSDSIKISTSINDVDGLLKVELYLNGTLQQTINNPSTSAQFNLDTSSLNDGQYRLYIRIHDKLGFSEDSSYLDIAIDRNTANGFTPGLERFNINRSTPTTNTSLAQIVEGPDKRIWGMYDGNKIVSFDPCTTKVRTFLSPTRSGTQPTTGSNTNADMLSASNGKLYYVDRNNNGISLITTEGIITQFSSLPITADTPFRVTPSITDIVEGNDGNIWYAAYLDFAVGYIDLAGNYLGQVSLGSISPNDIAVGSDGYIWATQGNGTGAKALIKIDPITKTKTSYTAPKLGPSTSFSFADMKLGPDGNIWFIARQTDYDYIGKVTNNGIFTTYTLPSGKKPLALTPDSSGKMWFTFGGSPDPYGVGYVDINSGSVSEYIDNTNLNSLAGLATSTDNSIWFSLGGLESKIGRINLGKAADCTPPTVQITNPSNNAYLSTNSVNITVNATDDTKVKELKIYRDSTLIRTVANPSASISFNTDLLPLVDGTYTYRAEATDIMQRSSTSSLVTVNIDRTKPTTSLTSPTSNTTIAGTTTISANATDVSGIAAVQFKLNGVSYGIEDTTAPYSIDWDTTAFTNGTYSITAVAKDRAGYSNESSTVTVTILNPEVVICHFPGTRDERTMSVSLSAINGHLVHGDYRGACLPSNSNEANQFKTLSEIESSQEFSVTRETDNSILAVIEEGADLSDLNLEIQDSETLEVNGVIGSVIAKKGSIVKGNGNIKSLDIDEGAYLAPGSSPGCLTSDRLLLEGAYTFELGGKVACFEHDQVIIKDSVTISGSLEIALEESFMPEIGQKFIIIKNDGIDAVAGVFTGISEGSFIELNGVTFTLSYAGGNGNDVELTVTAIDMEKLIQTKNESGDSSTFNRPVYFLLVLVFFTTFIILLTWIRHKKSLKSNKH